MRRFIIIAVTAVLSSCDFGGRGYIQSFSTRNVENLELIKAGDTTLYKVTYKGGTLMVDEDTGEAIIWSLMECVPIDNEELVEIDGVYTFINMD